MKKTIAKLVLFMLILAGLAACRGPKECWGVSSHHHNPSQMPARSNNG